LRYKGLMAALELVSDRTTKKPADKKTMAVVSEAAYEAGVMLRVSGNTIILSPPLIITAADVTKIGEALDAGLSKA
ncbi:aminotransferase class III-fold pyridoxal phosphate-dependent enzyme, partial [Mesorhizobium sp. M7A.F.Ca.CA.004.04.2.1]